MIRMAGRALLQRAARDHSAPWRMAHGAGSGLPGHVLPCGRLLLWSCMNECRIANRSLRQRRTSLASPLRQHPPISTRASTQNCPAPCVLRVRGPHRGDDRRRSGRHKTARAALSLAPSHAFTAKRGRRRSGGAPKKPSPRQRRPQHITGAGSTLRTKRESRHRRRPRHPPSHSKRTRRSPLSPRRRCRPRPPA